MNFFSPAEVAKNYISTGKAKVNTPVLKMLILGILAGVFIAFGGVACTAVGVSISSPSVAKFIGACIFPGGLTMVLLAGSELFTGNCLLTIPLLEREIKFKSMIKNWVFVYIGNFIGSILVAAAVVYGHQFSLFGNDMAVAAISTATAKCSLTFSDAIIKGILCNFLVCIAVWISFAAKDIVGKIAGLFFPIVIFVGCGFEHSVADMYFCSAGLLANSVDTYATSAVEVGVDTAALTWGNFFSGCLLPVTIGNIIGGAILVGCTYWFCYLHKAK